MRRRQNHREHRGGKKSSSISTKTIDNMKFAYTVKIRQKANFVCKTLGDIAKKMVEV